MALPGREELKAELDCLVETGLDLLAHLCERTEEGTREFALNYEEWYSVALRCIALVLPERLGDFRECYSLPPQTKKSGPTKYRLSEYLLILQGYNIDVSDAISLMLRQSQIVYCARLRCDSILDGFGDAIQSGRSPTVVEVIDLINGSERFLGTSS